MAKTKVSQYTIVPIDFRVVVQYEKKKHQLQKQGKSDVGACRKKARAKRKNKDLSIDEQIAKMHEKIDVDHEKTLIKGFSVIPIGAGLVNILLAVWLVIVLLYNAGLPHDMQIHFERDISSGQNKAAALDMILHNDTDTDTLYAIVPLSTVGIEFQTLSALMMMGGLARVMFTASFCQQLCTVPNLGREYYWSWFALGLLFVTSNRIFGGRVLENLSHPIGTTLCTMDFDYFIKNDVLGFYYLCHTLYAYFLLDFLLFILTQIILITIYPSRKYYY